MHAQILKKKQSIMYLTSEKKKEIFTQFGKSEFDSGTPEGQVAMFTLRIKYLTDHLKENKKDVQTRRSLVLLVGKRRRMLDYLKSVDIERYRKIISDLGIRK